MTVTTTTTRQCVVTDYRDRRRREAARALGCDPVTFAPIPRPAPLTTATTIAALVADDAELLGHRDRVRLLAALTSLSQAESASRSAAALESIAASLSRLVGDVAA